MNSSSAVLPVDGRSGDDDDDDGGKMMKKMNGRFGFGAGKT